MVALWLVHNVQRGGIARSLHAIRDNEDAARAFGLPVTMRKLQAFGLAGFIAGLGGALFAHVLSRVTLDSFPPERSVAVVVMTVVGGIANLSGAVLGAAYLVGLPKIIRIDAAEVLVSGAGVLVLVMYVPGGLSQLVQPVRNRIIAFLAKRAGVSPDDDDDQPETTPRYVAALSSNGDGAWRAAEIEFVAADGYAFAARPPAPPLLRGEELVVSYGGVRALDGMTIDVFEGETLGIIGPNGSGKTTLFKAIAGFVSPDAGRVWLGGRDVSSLSPEHRAQLGLVRSFQDAKLFPTLSVLDSVRLACEREEFTSFASSLLGFPGARALERRKDQRARELVSLLGLDRFRHKLVGELSTGTRRIAEMCCLLALEPTVLLLDEPSSGIAQRETEALGELLVRIKRILRATVVVIEHDMPLVMGISDRVVAMESGRVVTVAPPHVVQRHEAVVSSYLGMVVQ
jgi:ABC-type branched-subunit amino acid transport system ATPase component